MPGSFVLPSLFTRPWWAAHVSVIAQGAATGGAILSGSLWVTTLDDHAEMVVGTEAALNGQPAQRAEPGAAHPHEDLARPSAFIVASSEDAVVLEWGLTESYSVRLSLALPPIDDEIFVASSDEEAVSIADSLRDGNRILASLGKTELRVVDLRSQ